MAYSSPSHTSRGKLQPVLMIPEQQWIHLVDALRSDDIDRAVDAAQTLAEIADATHIPALYQLLQDHDFFVREAAADPLARLEGARALPRLFQALRRGRQDGHDNDGLTALTADVIEQHQDDALPVLLAMHRSPSSEERAEAAWALGFVASDLACEALLHAVRDESTAVRSAAIGSLSSCKTGTTREILIQALTDPDEEVRVNAAASLGYLGDQQAVPALQAALHDPEPQVRAFAAYALERLQAT